MTHLTSRSVALALDDFACEDDVFEIRLYHPVFPLPN